MEGKTLLIEERIKESIEVKKRILEDKNLLSKIKTAAEIIVNSLKNGGKIILCGNGGSAADAQHIAAELLGKYLMDRKPLAALALTTNTSVLTAIGNDYSFDQIFVRQFEAVAKPQDVLIGISTSGNSANVVNVVKAARQMNIKTICIAGSNGGKLKDLCEVLINIPSESTPRIQESHIMVGHILCELVESELFGK